MIWWKSMRGIYPLVKRFPCANKAFLKESFLLFQVHILVQMVLITLFSTFFHVISLKGKY